MDVRGGVLGAERGRQSLGSGSIELKTRTRIRTMNLELESFDL